MPKYGGILAEVITSHNRPLPLKVLKEGVWEDMRMLSVELGGVLRQLALKCSPVIPLEGSLPF